MSVSVSIVSFNTKDLLSNCLKLLENQKGKDFKIHVLDNNSSDGSAEMVEKDFSKVKLMKSEKNLGFAAGHNKVLKQIDDTYAILINPDTEFKNDMVEKLVDFMDKNPNCAIAGPKLSDFDGKLQSNGGDFPFGPSLMNWLFNLEAFGNLSNFHRTEKEYYEKPHLVDWVGGTVMILRTEAFKKIGYFNEDFFMYVEDVELCYRVSKAGFEVMIDPTVTVKHKSGSSSKDPKYSQWKGEFAGLIRFYGINGGIFVAILARLLVYIAIFMRIIAYGVTGKGNFALTYFKVLVSIIWRSENKKIQ